MICPHERITLTSPSDPDEQSLEKALFEIYQQVEACNIPMLRFEILPLRRHTETPRLFLRYAFDRLPPTYRFGPARTMIRQALLEMENVLPDKNGYDLKCGPYPLCIDAVHSSMME